MTELPDSTITRGNKAWFFFGVIVGQVVWLAAFLMVELI